MADLKAKLELLWNDSIELPVKQGTAGFDVIDISKLGSKGYFTFDPVFLRLPPVNLQLPILMVIWVYCYTVAINRSTCR